MKELLPIALGLVLGGAVTHTVRGPRKLPWLVAGCLVLGALASWINGELESGLWSVFVSFDALQVWIGAVVYVAAARVAGRPQRRARP